MRRLLLFAGMVAVLATSACSRAPRPLVVFDEEFDPYARVTIGDIHYVTPLGTRVVRSSRGVVEHSFDRLPGASARVAVYAEPPRTLALDADRLRRDFLTRFPAGTSRSVQYGRRGTAESVTVTANGRDGDTFLAGWLVVLRQDNKTVSIEMTGPAENTVELFRTAETLADAVSFTPDRVPARQASALGTQTDAYRDAAGDRAVQDALAGRLEEEPAADER